MSRDRRHDDDQAPVWAEHTVVANLPRLLPGTRPSHAPLSAVSEPLTLIGLGQPAPPVPPRESDPAPLALVEEPRTVVGRAPSATTAQQLMARYAALSAEASDRASAEPTAPPLRQSWLQRVVAFARDDFRRAPRVVQLLVPALPLVAAAVTFLDIDPQAPGLSRPVAAAAAVATSAHQAEPSVPPAAPLPVSSVAIVPRPGHTLASDAADAAARGDRALAIAIYSHLSREQPSEPAFASAARILLRDEARNRPHPGQ